MHNRIEHYMVDEHQPRRRAETRFAPLSIEERAYLAQQAVNEGRIAEVRDQFDWEDNVKLWRVTKATAAITGAAVVAATAFLALVWVVGR